MPLSRLINEGELIFKMKGLVFRFDRIQSTEDQVALRFLRREVRILAVRFKGRQRQHGFSPVHLHDHFHLIQLWPCLNEALGDDDFTIPLIPELEAIIAACVWNPGANAADAVHVELPEGAVHFGGVQAMVAGHPFFNRLTGAELRCFIPVSLVGDGKAVLSRVAMIEMERLLKKIAAAAHIHGDVLIHGRIDPPDSFLGLCDGCEWFLHGTGMIIPAIRRYIECRDCFWKGIQAGAQRAEQQQDSAHPARVGSHHGFILWLYVVIVKVPHLQARTDGFTDAAATSLAPHASLVGLGQEIDPFVPDRSATRISL
ncbi:MAG: hypothetical protein BWY83_02373 [bacterium ADurb.Bin478]|nr:MAG: hypothetical protein BWY83_02373 [bacterium ADurb.Bin478]